MVIVRFQAESRTIEQDLVGGHMLKDEFSIGKKPTWKWTEENGKKVQSVVPEENGNTLKKVPPSGRFGMAISASWRAEIREAVDINGDRTYGVYCGAQGLCPGNSGKVI
ncbi:hypothetical protein BT63DRAFT_452160 [Microthyrium microscopicum]|uniref:Uncharacterized protein n=1 Tax=Microthyrium microscopicum TaxID=703497 RepID=A0A6A6UIX6_9PEZI|nr:hypothetical protein BT63DRAFT_452160 [Microthyrium microscopicum]